MNQPFWTKFIVRCGLGVAVLLLASYSALPAFATGNYCLMLNPCGSNGLCYAQWNKGAGVIMDTTGLDPNTYYCSCADAATDSIQPSNQCWE